MQIEEFIRLFLIVLLVLIFFAGAMWFITMPEGEGNTACEKCGNYFYGRGRFGTCPNCLRKYRG